MEEGGGGGRSRGRHSPPSVSCQTIPSKVTEVPGSQGPKHSGSVMVPTLVPTHTSDMSWKIYGKPCVKLGVETRARERNEFYYFRNARVRLARSPACFIARFESLSLLPPSCDRAANSLRDSATNLRYPSRSIIRDTIAVNAGARYSLSDKFRYIFRCIVIFILVEGTVYIYIKVRQLFRIEKGTPLFFTHTIAANPHPSLTIYYMYTYIYRRSVTFSPIKRPRSNPMDRVQRRRRRRR